MTIKQTLLKWLYPFLMRITGKKATTLLNKKSAIPPQSFYRLKAILNNGAILNFETLRGKKILLVNTASDCGYTPQYQALQQLFEQHKNTLAIIGFPANDFKEQEKGSDEAIAQFCQLNYGITFPLAKKSVVVKGDHQNGVFQWLSHENLNGWNNQSPRWNFSKYLVNEKGMLTHYFDPSVSPTSKIVTEAVSG